MEDYTPEEISLALRDVYSRLIEEGWMKQVPDGKQMRTSEITDEARAIMMRLKRLFRGRGREFTDAHYAAFVTIVLHTTEDS